MRARAKQANLETKKANEILLSFKKLDAQRELEADAAIEGMACCAVLSCAVLCCAALWCYVLLCSSESWRCQAFHAHAYLLADVLAKCNLVTADVAVCVWWC